MEELIEQSDDMKRLHPESVNTVRIPAYRTRKGLVVHRPFLRVGTGAHIVDNGGNGGILIAVDKETGTTISLGVDERGIKYVYHPDTKILLVGIQLPEWSKAITIVKKAMDMVPNGINIVGWDLAHTDHGWVIVEGNHKGQFVGQQMAYMSPCKDEVENILKEID